MTNAFKQRRSRIGALTFVLAGLFGLAVMRLIALVVLQGSLLTSMAREEHNAETELAAVRGPIVDRHGEPMALSAETRSIYARPKKVLECEFRRACETCGGAGDERCGSRAAALQAVAIHMAAAPDGSCEGRRRPRR